MLMVALFILPQIRMLDLSKRDKTLNIYANNPSNCISVAHPFNPSVTRIRQECGFVPRQRFPQKIGHETRGQRSGEETKRKFTFLFVLYKAELRFLMRTDFTMSQAVKKNLSIKQSQHDGVFTLHGILSNRPSEEKMKTCV